MEKTIKNWNISAKAYHICHLFINSSYLVSLWMTRVGMSMVCVFSLPCPFDGLMFIAFGIMEVGLLAARSHVLL